MCPESPIPVIRPLIQNHCLNGILGSLVRCKLCIASSRGIQSGVGTWTVWFTVQGLQFKFQGFRVPKVRWQIVESTHESAEMWQTCPFKCPFSLFLKYRALLKTNPTSRNGHAAGAAMTPYHNLLRCFSDVHPSARQQATNNSQGPQHTQIRELNSGAMSASCSYNLLLARRE